MKHSLDCAAMQLRGGLAYLNTRTYPAAQTSFEKALKNVQDALLELSDNQSSRPAPAENYGFREKATDFLLGSASVIGFSLAVGALGAFLAYITEDVRESDRRNVRVVFDPESGQLRLAQIFDSHPMDDIQSLGRHFTSAVNLDRVRTEVAAEMAKAAHPIGVREYA